MTWYLDLALGLSFVLAVLVFGPPEGWANRIRGQRLDRIDAR